MTKEHRQSQTLAVVWQLRKKGGFVCGRQSIFKIILHVDETAKLRLLKSLRNDCAIAEAVFTKCKKISGCAKSYGMCGE